MHSIGPFHFVDERRLTLTLLSYSQRNLSSSLRLVKIFIPVTVEKLHNRDLLLAGWSDPMAGMEFIMNCPPI